MQIYKCSWHIQTCHEALEYSLIDQEGYFVNYLSEFMIYISLGWVGICIYGLMLNVWPSSLTCLKVISQ